MIGGLRNDASACRDVIRPLETDFPIVGGWSARAEQAGAGSLFVDQASPFIKRIVRHGEFMPFPGMIGGLLECLFDRLSVDLEIAVEPRFAET
jgi:hypothetical protein